MTRALLDRTGLTHCTHTAFWYGISVGFSMRSRRALYQ